MRNLLLTLSALALALVVVPPALNMSGSLETDAMKAIMLAGTVLWFIAWPLADRGRGEP